MLLHARSMYASACSTRIPNSNDTNRQSTENKFNICDQFNMWDFPLRVRHPLQRRIPSSFPENERCRLPPGVRRMCKAHRAPRRHGMPTCRVLVPQAVPHARTKWPRLLRPMPGPPWLSISLGSGRVPMRNSTPHPRLGDAELLQLPLRPETRSRSPGHARDGEVEHPHSGCEASRHRPKRRLRLRKASRSTCTPRPHPHADARGHRALSCIRR